MIAERVVLRRLSDLQALPDDQAYLCSDRAVADEHQIKVPFRCGGLSWKGGGLVSVELHSGRDAMFPGSGFKDTALVALRSLTPLEGERWA